ncbi:hypothetical protein DSECCO2_438750 [anaerobic digester metagenome]
MLPVFIRKFQIVADARWGRVEGYKIKEDHAGKAQEKPFAGKQEGNDGHQRRAFEQRVTHQHGGTVIVKLFLSGFRLLRLKQ